MLRYITSIIPFNLQFLAAFIYSCSKISANTLPVQKAFSSERQTFSETTEEALMETRRPDPFGSFAHPAWTCPWVTCPWVTCPWCPPRFSLCRHRERRVEQPRCNLRSRGNAIEMPLKRAAVPPACPIQPGSPALAVGCAQALPGQRWIRHGERGGLHLPPRLCPARSPAKPRPACNVISIAILPLGKLTTRRSLIAPVICLSQQAAHPKQGD